MEVFNCINFILTNTQNAVCNYFKRRLQEFDITPSQYNLLRCLWKQEAQTPSQLAHELHLDTSTITGILGRLEKKDLIERIYNQEDRRSVYIRLREEGIVLWEQIDRVIDEANVEMLRGMSPEEADKLRTQLRRIEANAKARLEQDAGPSDTDA